MVEVSSNKPSRCDANDKLKKLIFEKTQRRENITSHRPPRARKEMALNPQLFQNGMPVPFVNEIFVLTRDGVEFEIDKIPGSVAISISLDSFKSSVFISILDV